MKDTRTYWLSFADPSTGRNLGVVIVTLTAEDAATALEAAPDMFDKTNGPWIVAAAQKAWLLGCNPGGEVVAYRVSDDAVLPHDRLLQRAEILALDIGESTLEAGR